MQELAVREYGFYRQTIFFTDFRINSTRSEVFASALCRESTYRLTPNLSFPPDGGHP